MNKKEISELLSGLWTDANMALDGDWDKSDEGFRVQAELIEKFCEKHKIELINTIKPESL